MSEDSGQIDDQIDFEITEEDRSIYKRLDQFLSDKITHLSRSFLKSLFKQQLIILSENNQVEDQKLELKRMPLAGTLISVLVPPSLPSSAQPENIPLDIIFEDEHLLFVNKPAGMVTHPAPGNYTGTLVNAVLHHCPDLQRIGDQVRPGIVHRLDKGTTGVMVVAKNQKCHEGLTVLFSTHNIDRIYEALCMGVKVESSGTLESTLGRHPQNRLKMEVDIKNGRNAITHYKVLNYFERCTHMQFKLETGRTHQIRVHTSRLLRLPIVCDPTYGSPSDHLTRLGNEFRPLLKNYEHPLLHAKVLGLVHPITKEKLYFEVPLPEPFSGVLEKLKQGVEK